tara:strand:+ start:4154 stop:5791 length:1638 start_codon:yes stop_codon:yes gene_type:complete
MRAVTATEKYRAVNEGSLSKKEFVRQMRQQYPGFVSQFNGFDDTVQILKNRNMLYEAAKPAFSGVQVYDDRPALTYSLDALDRGIRAELQTDGIDFKEAEKRAKTNLEKNATHYLDLLSGESNKVDKHDRETEVKRGAKDTDVFNGLKKATLKEEAIKEDEEEDAKNDLDSYDHDFPHQDEEVVNPNPSMSEDAKKALLGKVVGALRTNYPDITSGILKDFIKTHYQDLLDGADIEDEFKEYISVNYEGSSDIREGEKDIDMSSKDGYIAFIDNEDILANYTPEDAEEMARELAMTHHDAGQDQDNFIKSFMMGYKEGGYDTEDQVHEKQGTDHDGDGDIDGDDYMAAKDKAIKKAMGKDEGYAMKRMQQAHQQASQAGEKSAYDKKDKEKEDKDKQIKEAIKSIIRKTLTEDVINEAATSRLSDKMQEFGGYKNAQNAINQLENIVTDVESYYGKVREKIQKVYNDMENIENDEGLKIGAFIGPAIESAFLQDLRPVTKKGFTKELRLPKTKQIDPAMLAQGNPAVEVDEAPLAPKSTLYSPNI